jgi:hypothetical protein
MKASKSNSHLLVRALLKGNVHEGTRVFDAEVRDRITDALELRRIQVGKKLIGEATRKKTSLAIRKLTEELPVVAAMRKNFSPSKNGLVPIKNISGRAALSRWMAELIGKDGKSFFEAAHWNPIGYIENQPDIKSYGSYSPSVSIFRWKGKRVMWTEVSHIRYVVYELPTDMKLYSTDDAATAAYIASLKTQSEGVIKEDMTLSSGLLKAYVADIAQKVGLQPVESAELLTRVRKWERDWINDRSITKRGAQTLITNIAGYIVTQRKRS